MKEPNRYQKELINSLEGVYLVDAGAGTGKTFTLAHRYARILEKDGISPEDVLLTTFTENGAENMKERIKRFSEGEIAVSDAPITTFHSYCKDLLERKGVRAPDKLGIDLPLTSFDIMDGSSDYFERRTFRRFITRFERENPGYEKFFRPLRSEDPILNLIKELSCRGIFPTSEGWYGDGREMLEGDMEEMRSLFRQTNRPKEGKRGKKNSELKNRLRNFDSYLFEKEAPSKKELRPGGMKKVPEKYFERAFSEERDELFSFVHDVYFEYLRFCVENGYLNFQFLMMLAYVLLVEDGEVREEESFDYIMVDEFQDTNELQFKLSLVLSGEGNIAAVGDWKQSIFGFQNASVDNILDFEERLERYMEELSDRGVDTGFDAEVERISLKKNYRSAERILDISEESLLIEGSGTESLDREAVREGITSLEAVMEYENPEVSGFVSEDEKLALLSRIQEVVRDDGYMIDGENISFGDIAVITRTKKFGLELEKKAREYGIPVAFEGGVELFRTDPGKILLAWLRIVSGLEEKRGWSVVLDRAGHSPGQITRILDSGDYPNDMEEFMKDLEGSKPSRIAQEVFDRYGIDNGFTTKIISVLSKLGSTADDVIGFMEHCIENGTEFEVDDSRGSDLVTIRTVHRSKGLEYPAVFIPDINDSHFPSRNSDFSPLEFSFETGLRQRKKFDPDRNCIVDSWKSRILSSSFPTEYDEERRLFYVAMTRAKKYLFLSAEKGNESPFFRKMDIEKCEIESEPEKMSGVKESREKLKIPSASGRRPRKISAHHFIDTGKITGEGRGTEFGTKVHEFAESIINGGVHEVGDERDFRNTERFLGQLEGDIRAEVPILLPLETEDRKYTVEGIIDLLVVYDERVSIVDFKTDTSKEMEDEYRKQLSVYYHAIREIFPEKDVEISVFYTYFGEKKVQEPIDRESLKDLIEL